MTAGKIPGSCAQPIPCREDEQARLRGPAAELEGDLLGDEHPPSSGTADPRTEGTKAPSDQLRRTP